MVWWGFPSSANLFSAIHNYVTKQASHLYSQKKANQYTDLVLPVSVQPPEHI